MEATGYRLGVSQRDGVLVQEDRRGRVAVVPVWDKLLIGADRERVGLAIRGDKSVEPVHAELSATFDGRVTVKDLSQGGVWVNEVPVQGEAPANPGDVIRLGPQRTVAVLGLLDSKAPVRALGLLRVPQRIANLIFLRLIGRGAAGVVYEAFDESENRRCAVKVLVSGGRAHPELIERFKREARLQSTLRDYPGIVSMHTLGTLPDSGELYCVMEYVTGDTLRTRIHEGLERVEGVRLVSRVARAVHYAHEHGLLHRDLKPANVLVSDSGSVRLTDFGLCKALEEDDGLTTTGVMLGTPSFMAPEQIDDAKRVTETADVYALGAMLYQVLTKTLPFAGKNIPALLERVATGDKEPPRHLDPTIPAELEQTCLRAMALDAEERFQSAMELAKALEAWIKQTEPRERVTLRLPDPSQAQTQISKKKRKRSSRDDPTRRPER
ncbi:MAG TPA: hypothetical protein DEA08_22810 [Planctomycetes bacterium]|nr:hypothetical protein [Planctomycetota bacterium]